MPHVAVGAVESTETPKRVLYRCNARPARLTCNTRTALTCATSTKTPIVNNHQYCIYQIFHIVSPDYYLNSQKLDCHIIPCDPGDSIVRPVSNKKKAAAKKQRLKNKSNHIQKISVSGSSFTASPMILAVFSRTNSSLPIIKTVCTGS